MEARRLVGFSATDGPGLLSTSVTVGIGLLTIQWIVMLVLTMRVVLQGFRHPKATRCTVANILAIRTMVPVLLISVPSIVVSCLYNLKVSASTLACALIAIQMCSPIVSYMIKILGFKPYRIAVSGAFRRLSSRMSSESHTSSEEIPSGMKHFNHILLLVDRGIACFMLHILRRRKGWHSEVAVISIEGYVEVTRQQQQ